jgi:repressor of nif and glnA expression
MHEQKFAILNVLKAGQKPMSINEITRELGQKGVSMPDRTVRHYCKMLDEEGSTESGHGRGRVITRKGEEELGRMSAVLRAGSVHLAGLEQLGLSESLHVLAEGSQAESWSVFEGLKQISF